MSTNQPLRISANAEYNQMVFEHVLDGDTFTMDVECPECGKEAISEDYDRNDGGCINAYVRIDCSHCHYHECNDDFCCVCEAAMAPVYAYRRARTEYDLMLEFNFDDADFSKPVSPIEITFLKLYFIRKVKPVCGNDCNHFFADYVNRYLRNRADWNFAQMLNQKIELANQEIYATID